MKKWQKTVLIICCLLGMCLSVLYHHSSFINPDRINAPIQLNIEIDRDYMSHVSIIVFNIRSENIERLSIEGSDRLHNVILHGKIVNFVQKLSLYIPKERADETLNAIDGISVFIGNRLLYFSHSDVIGLQGKERSNCMVYELPGLEYNRSVITSLLNHPTLISYYGDLNTAVQVFMSFFCIPLNESIITWFFIICLFILLQTEIAGIYCRLKKKKHLTELLLLSLIIFIGFILRFNGYDRYSSWFDEIYSVVITSDPALPFMAAFGDTGNPPLYYLLLRFWFVIFGWTEQSARLFSVLIGTAAIIPLYFIVKRFAKEKAAFLASLYMATSSRLIGFSQEIRNYILLVFLVPIVVNSFLTIIKTKKLNIKNMIWYIIPSILLVNTHYYGSLFVFATFLFFIAYSAMTKSFNWKNTALFFMCNLLVAVSLLPFFIITAFSGALLDPDFNTWISRPGLKFICLAALIPFMGIFYIYLRKTVFKNNSWGLRSYFIDYTVFVLSAVFFMAFGISMYRPILVTRYLIILYPLLIASLAIIFEYIFSNSSKLIGSLCFILAFSWILGGYESERGGGMDVFHESQAFIIKDTETNPKKISMEILPVWTDSRIRYLYGYASLPMYTSGDNYDILYFNPLHRHQEKMLDEIDRLGIDQDRVLRIRTNKEGRSIFKIYADNQR
ncbi:MAG: glycosyltransferase family 39 protein [Treponema sp.]|jgi:hypothetical protein|nr:glycosyltransferase family 39 protein [Treponema sp.]